MADYNKAVAFGLAEHANLAYFPKEALGVRFEHEEFAFIEGYGRRVNTQAFVVTLNQGVIVAFRGTQQWEDVMTDLWASTTIRHRSSPLRRVHEGFCAAYEAVSDQILDEIKKRKPARVYVTGHSLGGALATLAALDIAQMETAPKVKPPEVTMYNFGGPRVGDWGFAEYYNGIVDHSHRVVAGRDAVPHLPTAGWWPLGYRHVDHEYKLESVALPFFYHDLVQSYLPQLSHESGGQPFFDRPRAVAPEVRSETLAETTMERNN